MMGITAEKMNSIIKKMLEITKDDEFNKLKEGIIEERFKYLMTVDMGCGNTSLAVYKIADGEVQLIVWEYLEQGTYGNIQNIKDFSIPTILGFNVVNPVIGPEAMRYGGAVENFKTIPSNDNLDSIIYDKVGNVKDIPLRSIWECYFKLVMNIGMNKARERIQDISNENIIFVVAHPSDDTWIDYLDSYKHLICKGTGLNSGQVITFSEAKAAMQYIKTFKNYKIDWENGVIIIDLGASTIDIAYLAYGQKQKEYSITMAGKEVDRILGHKVLSEFYPNELNNYELNELPDDQFFWNHRYELALGKREFSYLMRGMKEDACKGIPRTFTRNGESITIDAHLIQHLLSTVKFDFIAYNPAIAEYMNNQSGMQVVHGTWYDHLDKLVRYVLREIAANGRYADKIIVTGGTANLFGIDDCIRDAIRDTWGDNWCDDWDDRMIILNQLADYEKTVPYGSAAYLGKVINHMNDMSKFPGKLEEILTEEVTKKVAPAILKAIAPLVAQSMQNVVDDWAALPERANKSSINALRNNLERININQNTIDNAIDAAIGNVNANINIAQLGRTKNVIEDFLSNLSIDQAYKRPIGNIKIQCHMTTASIRQVAVESVRQLDINACITGLLNMILRFVNWILHGNDGRLPRRIRMNIKNNFNANFLEQNIISDELLKVIYKEFPATFKANEGFGMFASLMEGLEMDINQAMFM